jgi:hypothetical protein
VLGGRQFDLQKCRWYIWKNGRSRGGVQRNSIFRHLGKYNKALKEKEKGKIQSREINKK